MNNLPNIKSILKAATVKLEASGIESARLDASILLAHVLGISREMLLITPEKLLNNIEIQQFNELIVRRVAKEPVAYIIGEKEFWSLDFIVTPDTLIPRPDSEKLVEAALKRAKIITAQQHFRENGRVKPLTLLDIGTGTACLLVALLKELPSALGIGVDISQLALQVAEENAKRHNVISRAQFFRSLWCDAVNGTFDLVISNPPYIATAEAASLMEDVVKYEPHSALFAGNDGLDAYRAISAQVSSKLNRGGYVLLEVGQGQAGAVAGLLQNAGLAIDGIEKDLAGIERCVIAQKIN